jgi:hypothetical protein
VLQEEVRIRCESKVAIISPEQAKRDRKWRCKIKKRVWLVRTEAWQLSDYAKPNPLACRKLTTFFMDSFQIWDRVIDNLYIQSLRIPKDGQPFIGYANSKETWPPCEMETSDNIPIDRTRTWTATLAGHHIGISRLGSQQWAEGQTSNDIFHHQLGPCQLSSSENSAPARQALLWRRTRQIELFPKTYFYLLGQLL